MKLNKYWEHHIDKGHKHIASYMSDFKINEHIKRLQRHIKNIEFNKINTILDWGCGGGILSKYLSQFGDVMILDISEESLKECIKYVDFKPTQSILFPNNPDDFNIPNIKIDLINCIAVIHHFPSIDYWNKISAIWNKINPIYIMVQIKIAKEISKEQGTKYFENNNYINGLCLTKNDFLSKFPNYKCEYYKEEKSLNNETMLAWIVLKNTNG